MDNDADLDYLERMLRNGARTEFQEEGVIEFDDEPVVSHDGSAAKIREAGGAYVQAWVWVPLD